jgi:hypothetical protein
MLTAFQKKTTETLPDGVFISTAQCGIEAF